MHVAVRCTLLLATAWPLEGALTAGPAAPALPLPLLAPPRPYRPPAHPKGLDNLPHAASTPQSGRPHRPLHRPPRNPPLPPPPPGVLHAVRHIPGRRAGRHLGARQAGPADDQVRPRVAFGTAHGAGGSGGRLGASEAAPGRRQRRPCAARRRRRLHSRMRRGWLARRRCSARARGPAATLQFPFGVERCTCSLRPPPTGQLGLGFSVVIGKPPSTTPTS
jgi:hypothetical protein